MQERQKKSKVIITDAPLSATMQEEFERIKNAEIIPKTRIVKLKYTSYCGCGGGDTWIEREVSYDSPLQNGSRINDILSTDKVIH